MKTSRKLLPLLLLICILFGCVSANADTELTAENGTNTAQSTVVLDLGEQPTTYTIVIPSQITIDPTTGTGTGVITLKSGFVLTDITSLNVRLTDGYSEEAYGGGLNGGAQTHTPAKIKLQNSANDSYLYCEISASSTLKKTTNLISVTNQTDNTSDQTATLSFKVSSDMPSYGVYTGTLTFSVVTE